MSNYTLQAGVREATGKEKMKKLRREGKAPAIVYGMKDEPVSLALDIRETELLLGRIHGEKVLVDLNYGGKSDRVFVRNIQRDPAKNHLLHVDFFRVDMKKEFDTKVPVISVGTPKGVKEGGLLDHSMYEIAVRCLPKDVPPHIEVDVSGLNIGDAIHLADLPEIPGVQFTDSEDAVLFSVHGVSAEPILPEEEEAAEGEEVAVESTEGEESSEEGEGGGEKEES